MLSAIPPKRADSSNWEPRRELSGCSAGSLGQTDGTEVVTVRVRVDLANPYHRTETSGDAECYPCSQSHKAMLPIVSRLDSADAHATAGFDETSPENRTCWYESFKSSSSSQSTDADSKSASDICGESSSNIA